MTIPESVTTLAPTGSCSLELDAASFPNIRSNSELLNGASINRTQSSRGAKYEIVFSNVFDVMPNLADPEFMRPVVESIQSITKNFPQGLVQNLNKYVAEDVIVSFSLDSTQILPNRTFLFTQSLERFLEFYFPIAHASQEEFFENEFIQEIGSLRINWSSNGKGNKKIDTVELIQHLDHTDNSLLKIIFKQGTSISIEKSKDSTIVSAHLSDLQKKITGLITHYAILFAQMWQSSEEHLQFVVEKFKFKNNQFIIKLSPDEKLLSYKSHNVSKEFFRNSIYALIGSCGRVAKIFGEEESPKLIFSDSWNASVGPFLAARYYNRTGLNMSNSLQDRDERGCFSQIQLQGFQQLFMNPTERSLPNIKDTVSHVSFLLMHMPFLTNSIEFWQELIKSHCFLNTTKEEFEDTRCRFIELSINLGLVKPDILDRLEISNYSASNCYYLTLLDFLYRNFNTRSNGDVSPLGLMSAYLPFAEPKVRSEVVTFLKNNQNDNVRQLGEQWSIFLSPDYKNSFV